MCVRVGCLMFEMFTGRRLIHVGLHERNLRSEWNLDDMLLAFSQMIPIAGELTNELVMCLCAMESLSDMQQVRNMRFSGFNGVNCYVISHPLPMRLPNLQSLYNNHH